MTSVVKDWADAVDGWEGLDGIESCTPGCSLTTSFKLPVTVRRGSNHGSGPIRQVVHTTSDPHGRYYRDYMRDDTKRDFVR